MILDLMIQSPNKKLDFLYGLTPTASAIQQHARTMALHLWHGARTQIRRTVLRSNGGEEETRTLDIAAATGLM
jgi:hypothetical protein